MTIPRHSNPRTTDRSARRHMLNIRTIKRRRKRIQNRIISVRTPNRMNLSMNRTIHRHRHRLNGKIHPHLDSIMTTSQSQMRITRIINSRPFLSINRTTRKRLNQRSTNILPLILLRSINLGNTTHTQRNTPTSLNNLNNTQLSTIINARNIRLLISHSVRRRNRSHKHQTISNRKCKHHKKTRIRTNMRISRIISHHSQSAQNTSLTMSVKSEQQVTPVRNRQIRNNQRPDHQLTNTRRIGTSVNPVKIAFTDRRTDQNLTNPLRQRRTDNMKRQTKRILHTRRTSSNTQFVIQQ